MLVYRFNIIFEDEADVIRVIDIQANQSFLDLHLAIQKAIGFDASKPASFYLSSDHWRKGKEISSEEKANAALMEKSRMNQFIADPHQKIVYVSDYDEEWTLRLSLMRILKSDPKSSYPALVRSEGEAPKQYKNLTPLADPENEFDALVKSMLGGKEPAKPVEGSDEPKKTTASIVKKLKIEDEEEGYDDEDYQTYESVEGDEDEAEDDDMDVGMDEDEDDDFSLYGEDEED
jgi:hypothetical protein